MVIEEKIFSLTIGNFAAIEKIGRPTRINQKGGTSENTTVYVDWDGPDCLIFRAGHGKGTTG